MQNYKLKHLEAMRLAGVSQLVFSLKRQSPNLVKKKKDTQFSLLGGSEPELRKFYWFSFDLSTFNSFKSIKKLK